MNDSRTQAPLGAAALIAIDWGTTSLRAHLLDHNGATLDSRATAQGIMQVAPGTFPETLAALVSSWHTLEEPLPVLLSGMIGSKQGWVEVPYVDSPASAAALAQHLVQVVGRNVWIVPGVKHLAGDVFDVMRGEETQLVGAQQDGLFVLPGTHSKWVVVERGSIVRFCTYMTGEVFAALRQHTILSRLMPGELQEDKHDVGAFARGVERARTEPRLLANLFSARTTGLFNQIAPEALASYLSGLLIGAEFVEAREQFAEAWSADRPLILNGSAALTARYAEAAALFGVRTVTAPHDCAARGAWRIATSGGII